ncbi:glycine--tRNA ligase [Candidatus Daviesbacteria bacterium]|nr:glycine--tRNA ligase [Candidatus Daviesbacteria bacterium]
MDNNLLEKLVALCKRRGFIFPGSEIYGGLSGTWDYGPLGVEFKKNIKDLWWKDMVQARDDIVGLDGAIMMNPRVWEASGHLEAFTDPLVECLICHERFRADHDEEIKKHTETHHQGKGEWTEPRQFNLLVKAYLGVIEGKQTEIYLRGEITQGVHVNFKNVLDSTRVKIPFGIAQIGKAFRNEITPGNFTFRSREFEQMEVQYYVEPDEKKAMEQFEYWKKYWMSWFTSLGIKAEKLRFKDHAEGERAHYAKAATDIEYQAPWGWAEFMGVHHRGDWDLKRHQEYSSQNLKYNEFLPWDIESSLGVDRSLLFFLLDAYSEENGRTVLKLHPKLAPYKVAVFPLLANKPELVEAAQKICLDLKKEFMVAWDERGNIGGRYASQDEIGTPFCVTVDFQSLEDEMVTVRDRDTAKQERVKIDKLSEEISKRINHDSRSPQT